MDEDLWNRSDRDGAARVPLSRMPAYLDRGSQRDTMLLLAPMRITGGGSTTLRVRNVSSGGLMAEIDIPVPENAHVEVDLRSAGTVSARVAWAQNGRLGLEFAGPIDPRAVRQRPKPAEDETKLIITVARRSARPPLKTR